MVLRRTLIGCLILLCANPKTTWAENSGPPNAVKTLFVYPSNHGFIHSTGYHVPYGWAALYRIHHPEASLNEARRLVAEWIDHHLVRADGSPTNGCACK